MGANGFRDPEHLVGPLRYRIGTCPASLFDQIPSQPGCHHVGILAWDSLRRVDAWRKLAQTRNNSAPLMSTSALLFRQQCSEDSYRAGQIQGEAWTKKLVIRGTRVFHFPETHPGAAVRGNISRSIKEGTKA
ncbi:hypothetical protein MPLB_1790022 [Mesorhizobium sp. ORS 3324]|nr:hypothetical protein MPLB_1790022 [Mesorhizobium sp. ORS 3324]